MKRVIVIVLIFLFSFSFLITGRVYADETSTGALTLSDLNVAKPILLPGRPFYFLKNFGRLVERFFAFGRENKVNLELKFINERAAEIKILNEKFKNSTTSLERAIANYRGNMERLSENLKLLGNTGSNPNIEKILNKINERLIKHEKLFKELQLKDELKDLAEEALDKFEALSVEAEQKFDTPEKFKARLNEKTKEMQSGNLNEFDIISALNSVENKFNEDFRNKIFEIKENLIAGMEGKFKAVPEKFIKFVDAVKLDDFDDLRAFDEIREGITDSQLKSQLNVLRQNMLNTENVSSFNDNDVSGLIRAAGETVFELKNKINSEEYVVPTSAKELLEKADFHLGQAQIIFRDGDLQAAFGQAAAAQTEAKNGLSQLVGSNKETTENNNFSLRVQFDGLMQKTKEKNLTRENNSDIYELFDQAEKAIIEAKNAEAVKNAKVILAQIEALIED